METTDLRAAYDEFIEVASSGGFGSPPPQEWRAEMVMAHLAANDLRLLEVTQAVLAGDAARLDTLRLDNVGTNEWDSAALEEFIAAHPDLIGEIRKGSVTLCDAAERLDEQTAATMVPLHLVHAGSVVVDEAMPWGQFLLGAGPNHVRGHANQLRALRT